MQLTELHERVARLEQRFDSIDTKLEKIDEIHQDLTRYRGFIGGIMFIGTAIWTFITFGKDYILKHWV